MEYHLPQNIQFAPPTSLTSLYQAEASNKISLATSSLSCHKVNRDCSVKHAQTILNFTILLVLM